MKKKNTRSKVIFIFGNAFFILNIHICILDECMSILTIILYLHQNMGNTIHTYWSLLILFLNISKKQIFFVRLIRKYAVIRQWYVCVLFTSEGRYIIFGKISKRSKICAEVEAGSCHRITIWFGWQWILFEFGFCIYLVILFIL